MNCNVMICPKCDKPYNEVPALSREDNATLICPDCGMKEALDSFGLAEVEQDKIKDAVNKAIQSRKEN